MEPRTSVNCSAIECTSLSTSAPIWQDILAQAMTGELLAAMNYTSLSEMCEDPAEIADALEHAQGEQGHAAAFAAEGRKIGVDVTNNVDAKHWKRLRDAFLRCITERDFIGCLIVQEIMLESFAVARKLSVSLQPIPRLSGRRSADGVASRSGRERFEMGRESKRLAS